MVRWPLHCCCGCPSLPPCCHCSCCCCGYWHCPNACCLLTATMPSLPRCRSKEAREKAVELLFEKYNSPGGGVHAAVPVALLFVMLLLGCPCCSAVGCATYGVGMRC